MTNIDDLSSTNANGSAGTAIQASSFVYTNLGTAPSQRWLRVWGKPAPSHKYETQQDYDLAKHLCNSINAAPTNQI
jgi:hypothetical protein